MTNLKLFSNCATVWCDRNMSRLDRKYLPINSWAGDSDIPVIVVLQNSSNAKSTSVLLTFAFSKSASLSEHDTQSSHFDWGKCGLDVVIVKCHSYENFCSALLLNCILSAIIVSGIPCLEKSFSLLLRWFQLSCYWVGPLLDALKLINHQK